MNAYDELLDYLDDGETVEGIVFGNWNWYEGGEHIPADKKGVVLSLVEAKPFMEGWKFSGFNSNGCYATYIWTNTRVIIVSEYDGDTYLSGVPRNPIDVLPTMCGG